MPTATLSRRSGRRRFRSLRKAPLNRREAKGTGWDQVVIVWRNRQVRIERRGWCTERTSIPPDFVVGINGGGQDSRDIQEVGRVPAKRAARPPRLRQNRRSACKRPKRPRRAFLAGNMHGRWWSRRQNRNPETETMPCTTAGTSPRSTRQADPGPDQPGSGSGQRRGEKTNPEGPSPRKRNLWIESNPNRVTG